MYLARTVAPAGQILTLDEVKTQLRITFTDEDTFLAGLIDLATQYLEGFNGRGGYLARALLTQTFELRLTQFPGYRQPVASLPMQYFGAWSMAEPIVLPMPPLQSVTSIKYLDSNRALQTMDPATYMAETATLQGRIILPQGGAWPTDVATEPDAVRITFVAGYGDTAASLPAAVKAAAKLLVGMYYLQREGGDPKSAGFGRLQREGGDPKSAGFGLATDALLSQLRVPSF